MQKNVQIRLKLIKENIDLFSSVLSQMFNFYIDETSFPNSLKQADNGCS